MEYRVYIFPNDDRGAILAGIFADYKDAVKDARELEIKGHETRITEVS